MISRRRIFTIGLPATGLVTRLQLWAGGEFWNEKEAAQWSADEIDKMLSKSPWARTGNLAMTEQGAPGGEGGRGGRRGGGGGGMGGGGGQAVGGGGGGVMGDTGRGGPDGPMGSVSGNGSSDGFGGVRMPPTQQVLVRWESAKPVRDASKKALPPGTNPYYVVSIEGLPNPRGGMGGRKGPAGGAGEPADVSPEEMRKQRDERIMAGTFLQRKGKDPIYPEKVTHAGQGGSVLVLLFAKEGHSIEAADKDVTLVLKMGPMELKVKFPLKDMMYKGDLAL